MQQQLTLDTDDIARAVREHCKLPEATVRFVADVAGGQLNLAAIVTGAAEPTKVAPINSQRATIAIDPPIK